MGFLCRMPRPAVVDRLKSSGSWRILKCCSSIMKRSGTITWEETLGRTWATTSPSMPGSIWGSPQEQLERDAGEKSHQIKSNLYNTLHPACEVQRGLHRKKGHPGCSALRPWPGQTPGERVGRWMLHTHWSVIVFTALHIVMSGISWGF